MFDLARLEQAAISSLDRPAAQAVEYILASQKAFCGITMAYEDDVTLLVIDL
jgi:serine phosphatase RsbU (regulator of sigma subunit)